jgi:hypothetical protein
MEGPEAMVEEDERLANALLHDGLEAALRVQEDVIDIAPYVADGDRSAEEQATDKEAARS